MKSLGILTFHFAYNYGAMLQAYALKEYLAKHYKVDIINYQPLKTRLVYTTNPFAYGMHPKLIMHRMLEWPKKRKQANVFEKFKETYLGVVEKPFSSLAELKKWLSLFDISLFGSDQIWNLDITGDTSEYYGSLCDKKKTSVVYAGSFGHDVLTEKENEYIHFMNHFSKVSVREDYSTEILKSQGISAIHVCDPVFLLDESKWNLLTNKPKGLTEERYILYYTLKNDRNLIDMANETAKALGVKLISIHPNANSIGVGKQFYGIGPQEFLWLIRNAEYVCTNSFHASAFSLIFHKKLIHLQLENGRGRVQSLLGIIGAHNSVDANGITCMDLSRIDAICLEEYINKSKEYLAKIYEEKENC